MIQRVTFSRQRVLISTDVVLLEVVAKTQVVDEGTGYSDELS